MQLVSLKLEGYRQFHQPMTIHFPDGLIGVCGPNGAGKTKLIEALMYALFGPRRSVLPPADAVADLRSRGGAVDGVARVAVHFRVGEQLYRVERTLTTASFSVDGNALPQVTGATAVSERVQHLLRLTPATFQGTFVARQRDVAGLLAKKPAERKTLLHQLIGVAQVERAIALASSEVVARADSAKLAQAGVRLTIDEALAAVQGAESEHRVAECSANDSMAELTLATAQHRLAMQATTVITERLRRVTALREQLVEIAARRATFDREKAAAETALKQVADDEIAKQRAEQVLAASQQAGQQLALYNRLASIFSLDQEMAKIRADVGGPLAEKARRRQELVQTVAILDTRLTTIGDQLGHWRQEQATADEATRQLTAQLEKIDGQRSTAKHLGPNGECETCGGVLGDRLEHVLLHLAHEAASVQARQRESVSATERAAQEQRRLIVEGQNATRAIMAAKERLRREFATIEGEIAAAQIRHDELQRQRTEEEAALPPHYRAVQYDPSRHQYIGEQAEREQEATQVVAHYSHLGTRRAELEEQLERWRADIAAADTRDEEIRQAIALELPGVGEQEHAQEALTATEVAEAAAKDAWLTADRLLAGVKERRRMASRDLDEAHTAKTRVSAAERHLRVAEKAKELLVATLDSLAGEARPHLEYLMDGWMLPLLGPRFKVIRLTEDYGIEADNGSGFHGISHFSGGEQTILAIMLRAAISLFCRERAGFDTGFLILDEVFGDQDAERRHLLVQFLEEIKDRYHQIIIVNHIDEVSGQLDSIVRVSRISENESRVEVL